MYYYLVASLPTLVFGDPPPFPPDTYLGRCADFLKPHDRRELALVLAGRASEGSTEISRRWSGSDTQLRNAVARQRAARWNVEAGPHQRSHPGYSTYVEKAATDAFAKATPLEREMELDRFRWALLDDLARTEPFGLPAVIAYGLKLRMAGRWAALTEAAGRGRLDELVDSMMKTT